MIPALVGFATFCVLVGLGWYAGYVRRVLFSPVPYARPVGRLAVVGGHDRFGE